MILAVLLQSLMAFAFPGSGSTPSGPAENLIHKTILGGNQNLTGQKVAPGSIEHIVKTFAFRLSHKPSGFVFCSGVATSPRQGLSALHCFDNYPLSEIVAEVFSPESSSYRRIELERVQKWYSLDLAMIHFRSELAAEIPFPQTANGPCDPNSPYVIGGFGINDSRQNPRPLSTAIYELVPETLVNFKGFEWLTFVKSQGKGCNGDSGGPIFCLRQKSWVLAGIASALAKREQIEELTRAEDLRPTQLSAGSLYDRLVDFLADYIHHWQLTRVCSSYDLLNMISFAKIHEIRRSLPPKTISNQ